MAKMQYKQRLCGGYNYTNCPEYKILIKTKNPIKTFVPYCGNCEKIILDCAQAYCGWCGEKLESEENIDAD